jgi:hypothetical protein
MNLSRIAAIGAVSVASSAWAGTKVPPGWMVVADSEAQFSGVQGQDGWRYRFDRGVGTTVQDMPYSFQADAFGSQQFVWCAAPAFGNLGTFCGIGATYAGANTGGACSAPQSGLQRSIRTWTPNISTRLLLQLSGQGLPCCEQYNARIELGVNGSVAFQQVFGGTSPVSVSFAASFDAVSEVQLMVDPNDGSCHGDNTNLKLRIFTPDCNANLVPDAIEIANGSVYDRNHDGVPDSCQCIADVVENGVVDGADLAAVLAVWGTDGGIYPRADTNVDGIVDGSDLAVVLSSWGGCP